MIEYSTYARAILSDSRTLVSLISTHCTTHKTSSNLISNRQINETFLDPANHFIQEHIHDYALYVRTIKEHTQISEEIDQQLSDCEAAIHKLKAQYKEASKPHQAQLNESIKILEAEYGKIKTLRDNLQTAKRNTETFTEEFEKLTQKQSNEWQELRDDYLQKCQLEIENAGCPLNDLEIKDLLTAETLVDVINRFDTLNLKLPTKFDIKKIQLSDYFYLKSYLAVKASLSRRMKPSTEDDIEDILL